MQPRTFLLAALLGAPCLIPATARAETLFDRLGGRPAIDRIVDAAVALYITDERIRDDFGNIALGHLRTRLADHLCVVTGGPCDYKGRSMAASHRGLALDQAKFNAVAEDFQAAMQGQGIGYHLQNEVMARLAPMHRDIVTR